MLFGAAAALGDAAEGREGYHHLVPTTAPGLVLLPTPRTCCEDPVVDNRTCREQEDSI